MDISDVTNFICKLIKIDKINKKKAKWDSKNLFLISAAVDDMCAYH